MLYKHIPFSKLFLGISYQAMVAFQRTYLHRYIYLTFYL